MNFLNDNIFLGVAVDVQEKGYNHQTLMCFQFQDKSFFFQTPAERLAILSNKKVFGMAIVYNFQKKMHDLHISPPLCLTNLSLQPKVHLNLWKVLYL